MKTAEEILNNHYPLDFITERVKEIVLTAMKEYAHEAAREALRNASENAMLRHDYQDYPISSDWIDKNTILDESNIPTL